MELIQQQQLIQGHLRRFKKRLAVAAKEAPFPYKIERLLNTIYASLFDEETNVNEILAQSGGHGGEIHAHFKHYLGTTIHSYVEDRRILAALMLLAYRDLDISEIAFGVGYTNYRTFGRAFKRLTGCSPSEYRAMIGGGLQSKMSRESVRANCLGLCARVW